MLTIRGNKVGEPRTIVEQNRSQSTGPSTPYPSGPTTPMRGQASVAQYWVKHTRLERVELLGPEACAVRTWWNDAPPDGTSTCTALLGSKVGSVIADTKAPSLKWDRIGCLWVPGTTCRHPKGKQKRPNITSFRPRAISEREGDFRSYPWDILISNYLFLETAIRLPVDSFPW